MQYFTPKRHQTRGHPCVVFSLAPSGYLRMFGSSRSSSSLPPPKQKIKNALLTDDFTPAQEAAATRKPLRTLLRMKTRPLSLEHAQNPGNPLSQHAKLRVSTTAPSVYLCLCLRVFFRVYCVTYHPKRTPYIKPLRTALKAALSWKS